MFSRLAVIGCGAVAGERHLPALADLGWRLYILVDPSGNRLRPWPGGTG